jgi:hypothetical protein
VSHLPGSILEGDESLDERKESLSDLLSDLLPAGDEVEVLLAEIIRQWDTLKVGSRRNFVDVKMIFFCKIFMFLSSRNFLMRKSLNKNV